MNFNFFACCLIILIASHAPPLEAQNQKVKIDKTRDQKTRVRQQNHEFLFSRFIEGKKCGWNRDKTRLVEVRLGENETLFDEPFRLPDGSERILSFFDVLVLRSSSDLKNVRAASLLIVGRDDSVELKKFGYREGVLLFRLPRKYDSGSKLELKIASDQPIKLSEIAIRSKRGTERDFELLKEWWRSFPKNRFSHVEEAFLHETANMSFEELNHSLSQNSEALLKIIVPARLPATGDDISMWGILSDRRVARLHEILSSLDPEVAAEIAKDSFERELTSFQGTWEQGGIVPYQTNHAIEAQLFLCSEFCSSEVVFEMLDGWNDWHSKLADKRDYQFKVRGAPDSLLVMSVQAKMLMKEKRFSLDQANQWLSANLPTELQGRDQIRLSSRWMSSSDSTPNRKDYIKEIPLFESHYQFMKKGSKEFVLDLLRAELSTGQ